MGNHDLYLGCDTLDHQASAGAGLQGALVSLVGWLYIELPVMSGLLSAPAAVVRPRPKNKAREKHHVNAVCACMWRHSFTCWRIVVRVSNAETINRQLAVAPVPQRPRSSVPSSSPQKGCCRP